MLYILQFTTLNDSSVSVLVDDAAGRWLQLMRTTHSAEHANVAVSLQGAPFCFYLPPQVDYVFAHVFLSVWSVYLSAGLRKKLWMNLLMNF